MHADQIDTSVALVRALLRAQHPEWADLVVEPIESAGTVHSLYRLGDELLVRMPLLPGAAKEVEKEQRWLPDLAPQLPLTVPTPVARGSATDRYPYAWSVYQWIDGETADRAPVADPCAAARELGRFVIALQGIDARRGPEPGPGTSFRGAPLALRDTHVRAAIEALSGPVDSAAVTSAWAEALAVKEWDRPGVWFHGDLLPGNLVVVDGRLVAVIDFGCCGTGDPAVDAIPAWSLFTGRARSAYRDALGMDDATWARGRGWALSGALLAIPYYRETNPSFAELSRRTLDEVLSDC
jgi:aminoglycoside phosphotransferase (APT) family kinase protein